MLCHLLSRSTFLFQPQGKKKARKTWAVLKGTLNQYTMFPKSLMTYKKPRVYCYHFMGWRWPTVSYFKCNSKTYLFKISSPEVFLTDSIPICPLVTPSSSTVDILYQGSGQRPQEQLLGTRSFGWHSVIIPHDCLLQFSWSHLVVVSGVYWKSIVFQ